MGIAIIAPGKNVSDWIENIQKKEKNIKIQVYPEITDKENVEVALLWQHPKGVLKNFPNLKLICSMGAGVDHILKDKTIDPEIPITRIVDDKLTFSMTNYVLMGVLNHHRQIRRYLQNQLEKIWDMSDPEIDVTVGVMGVGALGGDVIYKLQMMEFKVVGFGNSHKSGLTYTYYNSGQLDEFLKEVNLLVCMLPLTFQTENFLNYDFFKKCTKGTYLINVARGKQLVENDLLRAIEEGYISGALLDVFQEEPLPKDHPFWELKAVTLTPHIASVTNPVAASPQVVNNYNRMKNQRPLLNQINRNKGY